MGLNQDQIDYFWENGFVVLGKLLEDTEIQLLRAQYDEEFRKAREDKALRDLAADDGKVESGEKKQARQMYQLLQVSERNIHFRKLLYNTRILDAVQDLIGPNLLLFHDQALYKPAHTGGAVFWHQDNGYWKCRPATLVSCWMTLDDVDRDNGAMQLIPGSHLKPVWHDKRQDTNQLLDVGAAAEGRTPAVVELPAGGAMLHHCQTLHYTAPNTTDRQRRAFIVHFMQPGTRREGGEIMRAGFDHPVMRMAI